MTAHHNSIGGTIKRMREKLGYSQADLAQFLSVKREVISYYENDTRKVPVPILNKLADLFCIDLMDLLDDNTGQQRVNVAMAFRADAFVADDLEQIASFKKIVKNYLKMSQLKQQL